MTSAIESLRQYSRAIVLIDLSARAPVCPGNTSNTINCRRYELGDDDKLAACSIKTPKRSIYEVKFILGGALGRALPRSRT